MPRIANSSQKLETCPVSRLYTRPTIIANITDIIQSDRCPVQRHYCKDYTMNICFLNWVAEGKISDLSVASQIKKQIEQNQTS